LPALSVREGRAQCIFDDQQSAEFLGRYLETLGPIGRRSWYACIDPGAFENLT
jgi:hypothetical protein